VKVVLLLVTTSATCAVGCGLWEAMIGYSFQAYLPWEKFVSGSVLGKDSAFHVSGPIMLALLSFVAYIITLSSIIPISLYVTYVDINFIYYVMLRLLYTVFGCLQYFCDRLLGTVKNHGKKHGKLW